jgi:hypothetical protein
MHTLLEGNGLQNTIITVLGAFVGSIMTLIISKMGKIKCYLIDSKIEYGKYDDGGSYRIVKKIDNPEYVSIKIVIDFHNKSSRLIGIRETKIEVFKDNQLLLSTPIKDEDSARIVGRYIKIKDDLETINIAPGEIQRKKLATSLSKNDLQKFLEGANVCFVYLDERNKKKKILIEKF